MSDTSSSSSSSSVLGQISFLRADAQIPVVIGTSVVQHLQLAIQLLMDGRDTSTLAQRAEKGTITDPTEIAAIGLSGLVTAIYKQAQSSGQTYLRDITTADLQ